MNAQQVRARIGVDRTLWVGLLGGVVMGLVGIAGYFVVPLTARRYTDGMTLVWELLGHFFSRSAVHHAGVLVVAPFVVALVATVHCRRYGPVGWWVVLKVVGGVVAGPVLVTWMALVVSLAAVAVTNDLAILPGVLGWGVVVVLLLTVFLALAVGLGSAVGSLLGAGLARSWPGSDEDPTDQ